VLRLLGVPISEVEARRVIATLALDGGEHAIKAAHAIRNGLDDELHTVALPREQRTAILAVLEDPPSEALAELRGVLDRDSAQRRAM
jgi:hypothetical protein